MNENDMKTRTKQFVLAVIQLVPKLSKTTEDRREWQPVNLVGNIGWCQLIGQYAGENQKRILLPSLELWKKRRTNLAAE